MACPPFIYFFIIVLASFMAESGGGLRLAYLASDKKEASFFRAFADFVAKRGGSAIRLRLGASTEGFRTLPAGVDVVITKTKPSELPRDAEDSIAELCAARGIPFVDPPSAYAALRDREKQLVLVEEALAMMRGAGAAGGGGEGEASCGAVAVGSGAGGCDRQLDTEGPGRTVPVPPAVAFHVAVPKYVRVDKDPRCGEDCAGQAISSLQFPLLVKPLQSSRHDVALAFGPEDLKAKVCARVRAGPGLDGVCGGEEVDDGGGCGGGGCGERGATPRRLFPAVVQEFIPHGAVLWKICVVGSRVFVCKRPSLPDDARTAAVEAGWRAGESQLWLFGRISAVAGLGTGIEASAVDFGEGDHDLGTGKEGWEGVRCLRS